MMLGVFEVMPLLVVRRWDYPSVPVLPLLKLVNFELGGKPRREKGQRSNGTHPGIDLEWNPLFQSEIKKPSEVQPSLLV
jgi:hypothetical protein